MHTEAKLAYLFIPFATKRRSDCIKMPVGPSVHGSVVGCHVLGLLWATYSVQAAHYEWHMPPMSLLTFKPSRRVYLPRLGLSSTWKRIWNFLLSSETEIVWKKLWIHSHRVHTITKLCAHHSVRKFQGLVMKFRDRCKQDYLYPFWNVSFISNMNMRINDNLFYFIRWMGNHAGSEDHAWKGICDEGVLL